MDMSGREGERESARGKREDEGWRGELHALHLHCYEGAAML